MVNALGLKYGKPSSVNKQKVEMASSRVPKGRVLAGQTGPAGVPVNVSYARNVPAKHHEDFHLQMNRVANKFGPKAALNLSHNLFNAIPDDSREAMGQYVKHVYGSSQPPALKHHEEHLAHLISYLNSPKARESFHSRQQSHFDPTTKQLTGEGQDFQAKMKRAHRALQSAATMADESWTKKVYKKPGLKKSEESLWEPNIQQEALAGQMAATFDIECPEFKAAKFMSNGYSPTEEEVRFAWTTFEGDAECAALMAYKMPVSPENIKNLRQLMSVQELGKTEMDVAIIPRLVKPFNNEAAEVALCIRNAYKNQAVQPVKLNGKHAKGTALAYDSDTKTTWLLKPGSRKAQPCSRSKGRGRFSV